jgi:PPOX class probable F420-dependent enzyme
MAATPALATSPAASDADFALLGRHKYCQLVTFRRNGRSVSTPVWFAHSGGRLYVKTEDPSGKVRRIRRDCRVRVAPCSVRGRVLGPALDARARILPAVEAARAEDALRRRYGVGRLLFTLCVEPIFRLRGLAPIYLEVMPARSPQ